MLVVFTSTPQFRKYITTKEDGAISQFVPVCDAMNSIDYNYSQARMHLTFEVLLSLDIHIYYLTHIL